MSGAAHETTVRVRYGEVDRMGFVHHSRYLDYFEQARTEHLRSLGRSYREVEDSGVLLVVASVEMRFHRPARYDDVLSVRSTLAQATGARLVFDYEVDRPSDGVRVATGRTTLASTDRTGRPVRVPEDLRALLGDGAPDLPPDVSRKAGAASGVQARPVHERGEPAHGDLRTPGTKTRANRGESGAGRVSGEAAAPSARNDDEAVLQDTARRRDDGALDPSSTPDSLRSGPRAGGNRLGPRTHE